MDQALRVERSGPRGHMVAVLGTAQKLGLADLVDPQQRGQRDLVMTMIAGRLLQPASRLATTRLLDATSLGQVLGVVDATEDDLYSAMDRLLERQERIEDRLARRYLASGGVVLYDLSSTYVEGEHCDLAKRGHGRDGEPGRGHTCCCACWPTG